MRTLIAGAMALAAMATATGAGAQPKKDALTRDIRCMIILAGAQATPEQKAAMQMSQVYLFGRMDAESGDTDWVPKVMAEAKAMEGKDISAEQRECGAYLVEKGRQMVEKGERLQRLGAEMDKPKP